MTPDLSTPAGEKLMAPQPVANVAVAPISVAIIGTGDGTTPQSGIAVTPGSAPNIAYTVIQPIVAVLVRAVNLFLTSLVGLLMAGGATGAIQAADFWHLVIKCAGLALVPTALGALKDLVTIFGRLEGRYPLITGSI